MPIIPLPEIKYEDNPQKLVDKLNEAFRQLEYLLNHQRLNADNMKPPGDPENPVWDYLGINAEYLKYYPNKCWNSSFEVYNVSTNKPDYWTTTGVVSSEADFDNTKSLKLTPTQYAEQSEISGEGLADPAWWSWSEDTRFSFRVKGNGGIVRVSVTQGGVAKPVWKWGIGPDGKEIKETGNYLDFTCPLDWPGGFKTFACTPTPAGGKIKLKFENVGAVNIYIDAVTLEADWTKKWPSLYSHGPKSAAVATTATEYIEYGSAAWNAGGVEFILVNGYTYEPIVSAGVMGVPTEFATADFHLIVQHTQETVGGVANTYSRIWVYPKGPTMPTPAGAKIYIQAVCRGKVAR